MSGYTILYKYAIKFYLLKPGLLMHY